MTRTNDEPEDPKAETNGEPVIVTNDFTKAYGDTTAVEELNLGVEAGSVYGFLGPNGAGKTTTIRMLTALTPPIREELTAREQLEYYGGLCGMEPGELEDRIETLLERLELADDADDRIVTYSKGMRQKMGLVQAILADPDVVFLDELTSGLDPRAARTVRELLTELTDGGTTVFLSTHVLPVVETIATEVGILYEGQLVESGVPEDLLERLEAGDDPTLEDVFLDVTTG